jgi:predicted dehydrogenase
MRVAIAGLGGACLRGHLPAIAHLAGTIVVVATADPDPARRQELGRRLPDVPLFANTEDMLAGVACDVLVVATEPSSHARLVALGLEHGLHVVCEKPLTLTAAQHATVAQACARHPDLALISVHQYRFSPAWASISRWARRAARQRRPYALAVNLQRSGTDRHAGSRWRADIAGAGGMLADAGVHFLALAWTIDEQLEVLAAARQRDSAGHERSGAIVRVGSGVLTIRAWNGAPARHTGLELRVDRASIAWHDDASALRIGSRTVLRRRVEALSDRDHVDALYRSLYGEIVTQLRDRAWRLRRTAEALTVGRALVGLLDHAPVDGDRRP